MVQANSKVLQSYLPLFFFSVLSGSVTPDHFATPWTIVRLARPVHGLSRQEHQSGCHCLPQGIFLTGGWTRSPAPPAPAGGFSSLSTSVFRWSVNPKVIPPPLSLSATTRLFSLSVRILWFCKEVHLHRFLNELIDSCTFCRRVCRRRRASRGGSFCCRRAQAPGARASMLVATGLAAPQHVGSFQIGDRTHVPWQMLNHWTTGKSPFVSYFLRFHI